MRTQRDGVHNAAEVDVQGVLVWLFGVTICVELEAEVVCAGTDPGVSKDIVDSAVFVFCGFKQFG
jgi:hypothetical protein